MTMDEIEANHFALAELGTVPASKAVMALIEPAADKNAKARKKAA